MGKFSLFIFFVCVMMSFDVSRAVGQNDQASDEPVCCIEIMSGIENLKGISIPKKLMRLDKKFPTPEKLDDPKCIGKFYYIKGNYYRILGNYDSATAMAKRAHEVFNVLNDSTSIAESLNLEGAINLATTNYEKALKLFMEALEYGESNQSPFWTAVVQINIGNIYLAREDYDKALEYFQRTYEIYKDSDQELMKIRVLNNLGTTHKKLGNIAEAEQNFNDALLFAKSVGDDFMISFISQNIGHLLVSKREYKEARKYFRSALPLAESENDTYGVAYCLLGLGMGHYGQNQYILAREKIDSTILVAQEITANDLLKDAYEYQYKIDSITGKFSHALASYQKFKALQDSAIWILKNKHTEEMLVKYEAKQRQKDNEILQAQNSLKDAKLTKQSYVMFFVIIILLIMAISFYHTRKVNRLLVRNAATVEIQKNKLEQQAKELHANNKVTQEINTNLEKIVESRTLKITQQNTALRNYEFENSHSVRGPLARILGLISLMEVETLTEDQKLLMARIDDSANELDEIIKNMSKILGKA